MSKTPNYTKNKWH